MSDINLLGNISELKASSVAFNIAIQVSGTSGVNQYDFNILPGLRQYLVGRAYASIDESSLSLKVTGSVTQTRSIDVHACIIPATISRYPDSASKVASVPGSSFAQHSVTSSAVPAPLGFPDGVTGQLKPKPVWGELPSLVLYHEILGGSQTSTATVKISGSLRVGGIGFVQTWVNDTPEEE